MKDQELFDLCREVYERTGLKETEKVYTNRRSSYADSDEPFTVVFADEMYDSGEFGDYGSVLCAPTMFSDLIGDQDSECVVIPLYTSDYLLEKLPKKAKFNKREMGFVLTSSTTDGSWVADYFSGGWTTGLPEHTSDLWLHHGNRAKETEAETPLKALLKLTLALHEAGELS